VGTVAVVTGVVDRSAEPWVLETQVPCVYYEAVYESYRSGARGRGRRLWLPDYFSRKCAGLVVRDDSGVIRIAVDAGPLVLHRALRHSERLGRRRRVVASVLQAGDRVKVRGMVSSPPAGEPSAERWLTARPTGRIEIVVLRCASP